MQSTVHASRVREANNSTVSPLRTESLFSSVFWASFLYTAACTLPWCYTASLLISPCFTDTSCSVCILCTWVVFLLHYSLWLYIILLYFPPYSGPLLGSPVQDVAITLHSLMIHPGTSTTMVNACVSRCVQKVGSSVREGTEWAPQTPQAAVLAELIVERRPDS